MPGIGSTNKLKLRVINRNRKEQLNHITMENAEMLDLKQKFLNKHKIFLIKIKIVKDVK